MKEEDVIENFDLWFGVGLYQDTHPCCIVYGQNTHRKASPVLIAQMMSSFVDAVINLIPEKDQTEFEEHMISSFNEIVSNRHDRVEKYNIE